MARREETVDAEPVDNSRFRTIPNIASMGYELVTIRVGDPVVSIPVHKDVLCPVSGYFRGAFEGSFRESDEGSIGLEGVTERTFKAFLQWTYAQTQVHHNTHCIFVSGTLPNPSENAKSGPLHFDDYARASVETVPEHDEEFQKKFNAQSLALLRLYIFADRYSVDQLCDDIMTAMIANCHALKWWPNPDLTNEIVNTAFENLPSECTFNRYLASSWAYWFDRTATTASMEEIHRSLHPDFLYDVIVNQSRFVEGDAAYFEEAHANSCCFHEHAIFNSDECRKRLANNIYIFGGLIDACKDEPESNETVFSH